MDGNIRPPFGALRGILDRMAEDKTLEIPEIETLVDQACDAFARDFRYAEAMARQAGAIQARRESRSLRAA